jgi:hypothetical protein
VGNIGAIIKPFKIFSREAQGNRTLESPGLDGKIILKREA